jgi:DNA-binding transcriptional MerR regulator
MNMSTTSAQVANLLTIGELADRTGVAAATLRMWEQRHGFPEPLRLPSGHRRYTEPAVALVGDVLARRDAGVRLDVAIEQATASAAERERPGAPSVYAELRDRHAHLPTHQLAKTTLVGLSRAIEHEFCAKAARPHLFGAFQHSQFYAPSRARWRSLARTARSAYVFADFAGSAPAEAGPVQVELAERAPMRREWVVVCDAAGLSAALSAWELPGQEDVRDGDRVFESMWTVDPVAVRDAARTCAAVAEHAGAPGAGDVVRDLAAPPATGLTDPAAVSALFSRIVAYVDAAHRR